MEAAATHMLITIMETTTPAMAMVTASMSMAMAMEATLEHTRTRRAHR